MNCTCFSGCKDSKSFHSRLFMDLQERIKSACPDIQWCDHWWGQEQFSYRPAVAFPAVLIEERAEASENEVFSDGYAEPPPILCKDTKIHQITTGGTATDNWSPLYVIMLNMLILRNIENR